MNIKFSQLPVVPNVQSNDIVPIVRNNNNYTLSAITLFNYFSAGYTAQVYTSYSKNSSLFLNSNLSASSVFSTYSQLSSKYVDNFTIQTISGIKTFFDNSIFQKTITAIKIVTSSGNSDDWNLTTSFVKSNSSNILSVNSYLTANSAKINDTYTSWNSISSNVVLSDTTKVLASTAIKNIIALSQVTYDNLLIKDPYTFYIVV
jgi:hypothetical protein